MTTRHDESTVDGLLLENVGLERGTQSASFGPITLLLLHTFWQACGYDVVTSDGPMVDTRGIAAYEAAQAYLVAQGLLTPQQCRTLSALNGGVPRKE